MLDLAPTSNQVEVEAPVLYQVVIQRFYMAFSTMTIWAIFYATKIFYYMFYGKDLYIEVGALQYMDLDSTKPGQFGFSLRRLLFHLSLVCQFAQSVDLSVYCSFPLPSS